MISRRKWVATILGGLAAAAVAVVSAKASAAQEQKLEVTYYFLPG